MIIIDFVEKDNIKLKHIYSNIKDMLIIQNETGIIYSDVYDTLNSNFTYAEIEKENVKLSEN